MDLEVFKSGDKKLIGPNGQNLSGGQRQRIALCRALYQDSDLYILDDIFSSLDAHVSEAIFEKAIKNYLIAKGKTVILVISEYRYL